MTIIKLKPNEVCPRISECPNSGRCLGTNNRRETEYVCNVDQILLSIDLEETQKIIKENNLKILQG